MNDLKLLFDGVIVGAIRNSFESDGIWYGSFEIMVDPPYCELAIDISSYVDFVVDWNDRTRSGSSADASEFERFSEIVKSQKWSTVNAVGMFQRIIDAPVFFPGNEMSWRIK
jgi:hypothetical protein